MHDSFVARSDAIGKIISPKSVAVVGASNDLSKFGGIVSHNIHHSNIAVRYYVNPKGSDILGEKSYPDLADLPTVPDAVVLAVSADVALAELRKAGQLGIRAAVVFAAGFREGDDAGIDRERELRRIADDYGMAVIGPNCVGVANLADGCFLSSAGGFEGAAPGNVALIAQSGSLGIAVSNRYHERIRYMISTGNEAVVTAAGLMRYLAENDDRISAFALLLEGIRNRDEFADAVALAHRRGKRVVLLKLSGTESSARIAALHTGAVSGDIAPLEAFCMQHGVTLVRDLRSFSAVVTLLSATNYNGGKRLGVFTTSGGTAVLSATYAEERGLSLPVPDRTTCEAISHELGMAADRVTNPLDTAGMHGFDETRFARGLKSFVHSGTYDLVLVPLGGASGSNASRRVNAMLEVAASAPIPVIPVWQQQRLLEEEAFVTLYSSGAASFTDYEAPIDAMSAVSGANMQRAAVGSSTEVGECGSAWTLLEALEALKKAGLPMPAYELVDGASDPKDLLKRLGSPLALKVSHERLLHKSDLGLVAFPVTAANIDSELERMQETSLSLGFDGAQIVAQAGVAGGVELLCGLDHDPEMGAYAVIAAGGVYTEILKDSAVVLAAPEHDLEQRIEIALGSLRIWPILKGARGRKPADWPAAVRAISELLKFYVQRDDVAAMEVNPLIVSSHGQGVQILDARLLKHKQGGRS